MKSPKNGLDNGGLTNLVNLSQSVAANDSGFNIVGELPIGLMNLTAVSVACRQMLDAPQDLPTSERAFPGLAAAIRVLEQRIPGTGLIAERIESATRAATLSAASGATILSLSRRTGQHLLYALAIHVGTALRNGEPLEETALAILGAWSLRALFDNYRPSSTAIAKVSAVLIRPKSPIATAWSDKARARAYSLALRNLDQAIAKHEVAASKFGLIKTTIQIAQSNLPIDIFNRKFRNRVENLTDFATLDAVAASGGYDTLSASGLLEAGQALIERVKTGDKSALLVCLEIITHLPPETTLKIPLQKGDEPPAGALAWLDVREGTYFQTMYRLIERGARPDAGTEYLYEQTTQIVKVSLSTPIHEALLTEMEAGGWTATDVAKLLGDVGHHPNSEVVGNSAYRCTARRLQESVPALLIARGQHRWPVALATNSHFLVSRGRPSYGTCQSRDIDAAANAACRLLGWPEVERISRSELVGSFTTVKPSSVTVTLNYLAQRADDCMPQGRDLSGLIQLLNRHAHWIAMLLALAFALRRWLHYALTGEELRAGNVVHFDDKDVHVHKGPPVPIANFLQIALGGWFSFCQSAVAELRELGDSRSVNLAARIEARLNDTASLECVFTIDAVDRLDPVGCHTWVDVLPQNIRLRPSFARQFWPMQLMKMGVKQLDIDKFMRHQLDGLHPGSSHSEKKIQDGTERLRTCIDEVLTSLGLRLPKRLGGH
jgi:hypothetical protein